MQNCTCSSKSHTSKIVSTFRPTYRGSVYKTLVKTDTHLDNTKIYKTPRESFEKYRLIYFCSERCCSFLLVMLSINVTKN